MLKECWPASGKVLLMQLTGCLLQHTVGDTVDDEDWMMMPGQHYLQAEQEHRMRHLAGICQDHCKSG